MAIASIDIGNPDAITYSTEELKFTILGGVRLEGLDRLALPNKEYKARTLKNVIDGDGTVIYGDLTGGTRLTAEFCERENKPYIVNPTPDDLPTFVRKNGIQILNVAGNRGSKLPVERLRGYREQLREALQMIIGLKKC